MIDRLWRVRNRLQMVGSRHRNAGIVGGMATMPSRAGTAPAAIASALRNVEHLYLYLDRFDEVPAYAVHPHITVLRSQTFGAHGAAGKFLGLSLASDARYYMSFDDDIRYPADFSYQLLCAHRRAGGGAFGVHGSVFNADVRSYKLDRKAYNAPMRLAELTPVQVLATCGTLHAIAELNFDVRSWQYHNMVDLCFAFEAKRAGVPLAVIARPRDWIVRIGDKQEDSIFVKLLKDDQVQTRLVRHLLGQPPLDEQQDLSQPAFAISA